MGRGISPVESGVSGNVNLVILSSLLTIVFYREERKTNCSGLDSCKASIKHGNSNCLYS